MPPVFLPFDGWSPGRGYFGEGWSNALNLYPFYASWRPFRKFTVADLGVNTSLGPVTGAYAHPWMVNPAATNYSPDSLTIFAGSQTALQTVDPATGAFTNISRAAPYAAGVGTSTAAWRFASVGNDIWAVNWFDAAQRRTNNAGAFADGFTSTFKPIPRFLATVREHLLVGNLNQGGRFQDEIAWSDADNALNFDPPTGTSTSLASSKRLTAVPGQITGLLGGQYGIVFKRGGIFYLEYTSTTQVFRPDVLSPHVGTRYPSSIINSRYGIFFLGQDGFYQMVGLGLPQKISTPEVDQYLFENAFPTQVPAGYTAEQEDTQAMGFCHEVLPMIGWIVRTTWTGPGGNVALVYDPSRRQWSVETATNQFAHVVTAMVARHAAPDLYSTLAAFTSIGGLSTYAPWDSAGSVQIAEAALRYRPANFDVAGELQQTIIKGVLPVFSKTSTSGTPLRETVTVTPLFDPNGTPGTPEVRLYTQRNIAGWYPFQTAGRFFKISITCPNASAADDFAHFDGIWIDQEVLR